MRRITLTFVTVLATLVALQAECNFESFAIGNDFEIGNLLEWSTSEEINNKNFIVEKSTNGSDYEQIGDIEALGASDDVNNYRFLDLDARKGVSFYRIKQIDFDGDHSYSKIVVVNKATDNNFMVTSIDNLQGADLVELTVDFTKDLTLTYAIKDMKGDVLEEETMTAESGLQNITFDLSAYPKGAYKLSLASGEEEEILTIRRLDSSEDAKTPVAKRD